jgi:hypothetical protein
VICTGSRIKVLLLFVVNVLSVEAHETFLETSYCKRLQLTDHLSGEKRLADFSSENTSGLCLNSASSGPAPRISAQPLRNSPQPERTFRLNVSTLMAAGDGNYGPALIQANDGRLSTRLLAPAAHLAR